MNLNPKRPPMQLVNVKFYAGSAGWAGWAKIKLRVTGTNRSRVNVILVECYSYSWLLPCG